MSLPLPVLDDRNFQELVDGMRERLPRIAPEWTDHNASDPGITLLELFAYQGDRLSYRFDRVPQRLFRSLLRLLGCEPRRERVAFTPVTLSGAAGAVPAALQVADVRAAVVFQTASPFHLSAAKLTATLSHAQGRWLDRTLANDSLGATFAALGVDPKPGDALYLGFDRALAPADARLRLWMFGADLGADVASWQALRAARHGQRAGKRHCPAGPAWFAHYGVNLAWEYFDGTSWRPLGGVKDRTRGLSLSGPVRFHAPADHAPGGVEGHAANYFIRCRLGDGAYDCAPRIRGLRLNTLPARHAADVRGVIDPARSTGAAGMQFNLSAAPVVPGSVRLRMAMPDGTVAKDWRERADFDRSGPHASHFVLESASGHLLFGDGRNGAVPEAGTTITGEWRVGGGSRGNVGAHTLARALGVNAALAVDQPVAACAGADAESLDAAKARAFQALHEQRCAATLTDLERVACSAPALPVARAHAVSEAHPDMECLSVAGCVSIVIVPACVDARRDPTPALCEAVALHLEPRRPLALELHVAGPRYTEVDVDAVLATDRSANTAGVIAAARTALEKFLHPLDGGAEASGWKIGRAVYRSEVLALLNALPGVHHVAELRLTAGEGGAALCGDIQICANGLAISGKHTIRVSEGAGR